MSDYPNLEKLGVTSIQDVTRYSLTRETRFDILKIYYKRQPGSLLAQSKKFHFTRGQNHIDDYAMQAGKTQHVAQQLLLVIEELRALMKHRPTLQKEELKENIRERITSLESVIESKLFNLSEQVKRLE